MDNVAIALIPAVGMMIVAGAAVFVWRRISKLQFRWFWVGVYERLPLSEMSSISLRNRNSKS